MRNNKLQKNRGFTLIETMFAVIIMAFSITVFMSIVANSLFSARYIRNEIVANYLAQEAVDYIRNDRDSSIFFNSNEATQNSPEDTWNTFVNKYVSVCEKGCELGVLDESAGISPLFETCVSDTCHNFYFDPEPANGGSFYTYDQSDKEGKTKTTFSRKITVTPQPSGNEVKVQVTVYWKNGNNAKTRTLDTSLTRWQ